MLSEVTVEPPTPRVEGGFQTPPPIKNPRRGISSLINNIAVELDRSNRIFVGTGVSRLKLGVIEQKVLNYSDTFLHKIF